jgi:nitrite transporter NirC
MYLQTVQDLGEQAALKLQGQRRSLLSHLVRSMLAGMYVGACVVLIFIIGGKLSKDFPAAVPLVMGVCFGGALTFVIFAGSELFTGSNLVLTLGVLTGKARKRDLGSNWVWTWVGNLLGSALLAVMVSRSGVLAADDVRGFVLRVVKTKMNLAPEQLFWRAVLANWLVCLGVWLASRTKSDPARILLIWWCMFTFITCGFEHSVANMCGLLLGLLSAPAGGAAGITWGGYAYNLSIATAGNVVGGAVFVAGMYWLGSPRPAALSEPGTADARDVRRAAGPADPAQPALVAGELAVGAG